MFYLCLYLYLYLYPSLSAARRFVISRVSSKFRRTGEETEMKRNETKRDETKEFFEEPKVRDRALTKPGVSAS